MEKKAEQAALLKIEHSETPVEYNQDVDLLRFYSQCLDRPVFQDPFEVEGSFEAFDKAIEDTITAINTGCLRARDGTVLAQAKGKSFLSNTKWRERMNAIVDLLRDIRFRYSQAIQRGKIVAAETEYEDRKFYFRDYNVGIWMNSKRSEIIRLFSELCKEAGIPPLSFPRHPRG